MTITITLTAIISNFIVVVGAGREFIYLFQMFWLSKLETRVFVCVCVSVCVLLSQCQVQSARKKASIDLTQFLAKFRYPPHPPPCMQILMWGGLILESFWHTFLWRRNAFLENWNRIENSCINLKRWRECERERGRCGREGGEGEKRHTTLEAGRREKFKNR